MNLLPPSLRARGSRTYLRSDRGCRPRVDPVVVRWYSALGSRVCHRGDGRVRVALGARRAGGSGAGGGGAEDAPLAVVGGAGWGAAEVAHVRRAGTGPLGGFGGGREG